MVLDESHKRARTSMTATTAGIPKERKMFFASKTISWPVVALLPVAELDCSGGFGPRRCAALHSFSLLLDQTNE